MWRRKGPPSSGSSFFSLEILIRLYHRKKKISKQERRTTLKRERPWDQRSLHSNPYLWLNVDPKGVGLSLLVNSLSFHHILFHHPFTFTGLLIIWWWKRKWKLSSWVYLFLSFRTSFIILFIKPISFSVLLLYSRA